MSEERLPPIDQAALKKMVEEALKTDEHGKYGVLDISNRTIDCDFYLAELLLACGQLPTPLVSRNELSIRDTIDCPFEIKASETFFSKNVSMVYGQTAITFKKSIDFSFSAFTQFANFGSADFEQVAVFYSPTFSEHANFKYATFRELADFGSTTFTKSLNFNYATFTQFVHFSGATFTEEVYFNSATFIELTSNFSSATFKKNASFKKVKIQEKAILHFDHITTHDYFEMIPSVLNGEIIITDPAFESDKSSISVDLELCDKTSKGKVLFKNIEVKNNDRRITVRNSEGTEIDIDFIRCYFQGSNVDLKDIDLNRLHIEGGTKAKGFNFENLEPKDLPLKNFPLPFFQFKFKAIHQVLKKAEEESVMWASIYANRKAKADNDGEKQLGNDFYFWQQYFQRKTQNHPFFNTFYLYTSAYGLSFLFPFVLFSSFFLLMAVPYDFLLRGLMISKEPLLTCCKALSYWIPLEGLFVSGSASIPFIFSDSELIKSLMPKDTTHWETVAFYGLYILQHLIQGYLLFQIGAAIRNKVKR